MKIEERKVTVREVAEDISKMPRRASLAMTNSWIFVRSTSASSSIRTNSATRLSVL